MDVLLAGLLVVVMFNLLRQLERWLHQHMVKVGWLVTKNFQTTTILYYTFFLPGVLLHELVYWLVAGALDVHADQAIAWPEKQEIGELRLNFVKLSNRASPLKVAIISITPLFAGLAFISFLAHRVFDIGTVRVIMQDGSLRSISNGIHHLMRAPDFWLWAYVLFTVSNTMMPDSDAFKGWRKFVIAITILATVPLFILGVGDEIIGPAVTGPVADVLNVLSTIFAVVIVTDLIGVTALGTMEAIIERITGDSATFRNGKMVVMRREEALAQRKQEQRKGRETRRQRRQREAVQGSPSVYRLAFPVPGPPGKEPVTQSPVAVVGSGEKSAPPGPPRPRREEPAVVSGQASERRPSDIRIGPARAEADIERPTEERPALVTSPGPARESRFGGRDTPKLDESEPLVTDIEEKPETGPVDEAPPARSLRPARAALGHPVAADDDEARTRDTAPKMESSPFTGRRLGAPERERSPFARRHSADAEQETRQETRSSGLLGSSGEPEIGKRPFQPPQKRGERPSGQGESPGRSSGARSPFAQRFSVDTGEAGNREDEPLRDEDAVTSRLAAFRDRRRQATSPLRESDDDELTYEDVEESP